MDKQTLVGTRILAAIFFVVYLLFYIPGNFFHYYHENAGTFWTIIAPISCVGHLAFIIFGIKPLSEVKLMDGFMLALLTFGWAALNFFMLAGWSFNLPE